MSEEKFKQHADATTARNTAMDQIAATLTADGFMFAVWAIRDGQIHPHRTTYNFPRGDFPAAERQLQDINAADVAEDLSVAMALPLPFANQSSVVGAVNKAVAELNGEKESTQPDPNVQESLEIESGKQFTAQPKDPLDPIQQMSEGQIRKAVDRDETTD